MKNSINNICSLIIIHEKLLASESVQSDIVQKHHKDVIDYLDFIDLYNKYMRCIKFEMQFLFSDRLCML